VKQLPIQSSAFVMATYATRKKSKKHKMSEGPRFLDTWIIYANIVQI
jgi:hypothetical protein